MGYQFANPPERIACEVRPLLLCSATGKAQLGSVGVHAVGCCVACLTNEALRRVIHYALPLPDGWGVAGVYVRLMEGEEAAGVISKAAKHNDQHKP